MILVIDVGNTRLKWAWLTSTGLSDQQAVVHRDAKPGIWTTALFESGQRPVRVLVSNVAGPEMAKTLTRLTKKVFRVNIEFVTAAPEFQGLTNGYLDPTLLGADRWLALIGAWTKARSALCVVDAGTAVKVDSVDFARGAGVHHAQRRANFGPCTDQGQPTVGAEQRGIEIAVGEPLKLTGGGHEFGIDAKYLLGQAGQDRK